MLLAKPMTSRKRYSQAVAAGVSQHLRLIEEPAERRRLLSPKIARRGDTAWERATVTVQIILLGGGGLLVLVGGWIVVIHSMTAPIASSSCLFH